MNAGYLRLLGYFARPRRVVFKAKPKVRLSLLDWGPAKPAKPKPVPKVAVDDEMERAWSYFVRTDDFSLVKELRERRELDNWFRNRLD